MFVKILKLFVPIISLMLFVNISNAQLIEIKVAPNSNPGDLKMFSYTPIRSSLKANRPLIVLLHGCGMSATSMLNQSGWREMADSLDLCLLLPQQKVTNNLSLCFNWFTKSNTNNMGEALSIMNMVEEMKKKYSIDSTKIYLYGLSAGACMALEIAYTNADKIAGVASLAGVPIGTSKRYIDGLESMLNGDDAIFKSKYQVLGTKRLPKLIVLHGKNDLVVDYQNANLIIEQWQRASERKLNSSQPDCSVHSSIIKTNYVNENNEVGISFYSIFNLGHRIPVDHTLKEYDGIFTKNIHWNSTRAICLDFNLTK